MSARSTVAVVTVATVVVAFVVVASPYAVTAGVARLSAWILLSAGASVMIGRTGTVDLSTGATVAVGAYLGAVAVPLAGASPVWGVVIAATAGGAFGAASGALAGRAGARLAALPTLSITLAGVALVRAWPGAGGAAGYHAAPFLTGDATGDAVAAVVLAAAGLIVTTWWWSGTGAARAAVGARAPQALAAFGHRPASATAAAGALGGVLLATGGATQAMRAGSATPAGFGLALAAALALAATLGGRPPAGPVIGAVWMWGPAVAFPLVPVIGNAPPLLTTGILGLGCLALRRGRPWITTATEPSEPDEPPRTSSSQPPEDDRLGSGRAGRGPVRLEVPSGSGHDRLSVRGGEIVAVTGPNGSGKSTLLARIGGQLPDRGEVVLAGRPAPRGAVRRAGLGMARTWQQPPSVPARDLLAAAVPSSRDASGTALLAAVSRQLAAARSPAAIDLLAAVRTGPSVLLLDEPVTALPVETVVTVVTSLAQAGVAVVLVDHRPAVLAIADRTCRVWAPKQAPG